MPGDRMTRRQALGTLAGAAAVAAAGRFGPIANITKVVSLTDPSAARVMVDPNAVVGTVPERMVSLGFEKKTLTYPLFTADNAPIIALFDRLGPQLLRIGGDSVEREAWDPGSPGGVDGTISPSDIVALRLGPARDIRPSCRSTASSRRSVRSSTDSCWPPTPARARCWPRRRRRRLSTPTRSSGRRPRSVW